MKCLSENEMFMARICKYIIIEIGCRLTVVDSKPLNDLDAQTHEIKPVWSLNVFLGFRLLGLALQFWVLGL